MVLNIGRLQHLKQACIGATLCYFYGLAVSLQFHWNMHGFDHPIWFLGMGILFLIGLSIEMMVAWWHERYVVLGGTLAILLYGILGLLVAPRYYGREILSIVLFAPLILTLIGGSVWVLRDRMGRKPPSLS